MAFESLKNEKLNNNTPSDPETDASSQESVPNWDKYGLPNPDQAFGEQKPDFEPQDIENKEALYTLVRQGHVKDWVADISSVCLDFGDGLFFRVSMKANPDGSSVQLVVETPDELR